MLRTFRSRESPTSGSSILPSDIVPMAVQAIPVKEAQCILDWDLALLTKESSKEMGSDMYWDKRGQLDTERVPRRDVFKAPFEGNMTGSEGEGLLNPGNLACRAEGFRSAAG